jgi:hypothetical protein
VIVKAQTSGSRINEGIRVMKKLLLVLVTAAAAMNLSVPLHAEDSYATGSDVLRDCSLALEMGQEGYVTDALSKHKSLPTHTQQIAATQCLNYVVGFKDAIYVTNIFQEKNGQSLFVCLPKNNINNGQALRIVLKYLIDNPSLLSSPQSGVVFNAFYHAYPCGK